MLAIAVLGVTAAVAAGSVRSRPAATAKVKLPKKTIGVMGPINAAEIIKLATDATVASAKALPAS